MTEERQVINITVDDINLEIPIVAQTRTGKPIVEFAHLMDCARKLQFQAIGVRDLTRFEESADSKQDAVNRYVCIASCTDKYGKTFSAIGSAGEDNVSGYNHGIFRTFLPEIAQKRAQGRCIIMKIGIDAYTSDEVDDGEPVDKQVNGQEEEMATRQQLASIKKLLARVSDSIREKAIARYGDSKTLTKAKASKMLISLRNVIQKQEQA